MLNFISPLTLARNDVSTAHHELTIVNIDINLKLSAFAAAAVPALPCSIDD
jgi:hypothetical protein